MISLGLEIGSAETLELGEKKMRDGHLERWGVLGRGHPGRAVSGPVGVLEDSPGSGSPVSYLILRTCQLLSGALPLHWPGASGRPGVHCPMSAVIRGLTGGLSYA